MNQWDFYISDRVPGGDNEAMNCGVEQWTDWGSKLRVSEIKTVTARGRKWKSAVMGRERLH